MNKKIVIYGDVIKDIFNYSKYYGSSTETPTIIGTDVETTESWGGAALVASHLGSLSQGRYEVELNVLCGKNDNLEIPGVNVRHHRDIGDFTIACKERFYVDDYRYLQFYHKNNDCMDKKKASLYAEIIFCNVKKDDLVLLCDNNQGAFGEQNRFLNFFLFPFRKPSKINNNVVFMDSQFSKLKTSKHYQNLTYYVDKLFLNKNEFNLLFEKEYCNLFKKDMIYEFSSKLDIFENSGKIDLIDFVIKLGKHGSIEFFGDENSEIKYNFAPLVDELCCTIKDATGAGDAYLAMYSHAYMLGLSKEKIIKLATSYASQSCAYICTEIPKIENLNKEYFKEVLL